MRFNDVKQNAVTLSWLDGAPPPYPCGVTWGVPWPQGEAQKDQTFALTADDGTPVPVQTWPLAFWPDGSLKWTGHTASVGPEAGDPLRLSPGIPAVPSQAVHVQEIADGFAIDTGVLQCHIPHTGEFLLTDLSVGERVVAQNGRLVCLREDRSRWETERITQEEVFTSRIDGVTLEQSGPVRAVVKIAGRHQSLSTARAWLPFVVRLYFFAGLDTVRMAHSFVFDGDQEQDFIRGLGVRFDVPLREEWHNRHVRLSGEDTGLFAEPVRVIAGRRNPTPDLYTRQIAGQPIPALTDLPNSDNVAMMAAWDGWKLAQTSADSFSLQKRTGAHSAWIAAAAGTRSPGLAFVGDASGGLALGMQNFWQLAPTALEIERTTTDAAQLTLWLWSPDVPAMDLRHYDIVEHGLEASYEDIEPGWSTATGIARTTELTLRACAEVPANAELLTLAHVSAQPPRLVCAPEYYHRIPVFGVWSLPNRSTPTRAFVEDELDAAITFYQTQIEQRRWYGFWDFGDVMHSYDAARHAWRYDIGGFAWANTELMPDLWLWVSFLRTGRADIFRMAKAMTRHTQEVDVYHSGPFQGLGTRHNVRHWGCGAKEARIGQALLKRFLYYLTADERMGDLMDEVTDTDIHTVGIDPLRKIVPPDSHPTHARVGPDWFAFCSNWLAAWERTGDTRYRDKIRVGMRDMAAMPHGLFSGFCYGYDPKTGTLTQMHDTVEVPHLAALMGGPELMMELTPLIGLPEWNKTWLHYCRYLQAPAEEQVAALGASVNNGRGPHYARMTGYAAWATDDPHLAARAWREFLGRKKRPQFTAHWVDGPDVPAPIDENPNISTNNTAQWCLNAIELLELIGEHLPENTGEETP